MRKELEANRAQWDRRLPIHLDSSFYDVAGFRAGRNTLRPQEVAEIGEVAGRSLLHLMCHFGLDTMSWARLGASAVGVDFSPPAVEAARRLAAELELDAEFVCANLYDLDLKRGFDIVYTAKGVLCWLPDLEGWADVIVRHLNPGGTFYLLEFHPVADMYEERDGRLELEYGYFPGPPIAHMGTWTYADRRRSLEPMLQYEWTHSLSEILNALITRGLRLEFVRELPVTHWPRFASMTQDEQGLWRLPGDPLPLTFSLRARKA